MLSSVYQRLYAWGQCLPGVSEARRCIVDHTPTDKWLSTEPMPNLRKLRSFRYRYHPRLGHVWRGRFDVAGHKIDGRISKWKLFDRYWLVEVGLPPTWWFEHERHREYCLVQSSYDHGWWGMVHYCFKGQGWKYHNLNTVIFAFERYLRVSHDAYEMGVR